MNITKAEVRYQDNGFPWKWQLRITTPQPDFRELRYEKRGNHYFAEKDGYVSFFAWDGTPDRGFCGAHFPIKLIDGSEVVLKGPWSSNSVAMDHDGFPRSFACVTHESISAHITVEKAKAILKEFNLPYRICEMLYGRPDFKRYDGCYMFPNTLPEGHQIDYAHWIGRDA